jgi:DNA-binding response OmpR family regulator
VGTVLIVDDHLQTARAVAALLRSAGHRATCAGGGTEALAHLETSRPDVVVLDVMMPGMDGFSVLRRLRADPRFITLPVLMYSALDDEQKRCVAMDAGAQDYLVKGRMDWPQIQAVIERHLGPTVSVPKEL